MSSKQLMVRGRYHDHDCTSNVSDYPWYPCRTAQAKHSPLNYTWRLTRWCWHVVHRSRRGSAMTKRLRASSACPFEMKWLRLWSVCGRMALSGTLSRMTCSGSRQGWWRFVHWKTTTMPDVFSRCGVHKHLITGHKCWLGHRGRLEADLFVVGVVGTRPINWGGTLCVLARGRVFDHRWIMVVYICAVAPAWWRTCELTRK